MYFRKTWKAGVSIAVHNSYSKRMGRALVKQGSHGKSKPAVAAYNAKVAIWNLTMLLNENFLPGDFHLVLKHFVNRMPTVDGSAALWAEFMRGMRAAARKARVPFKYVHAFAVGERGALHHHMIINREMMPFVAQLWPHGSRNFSALYDSRNYQGLAVYFCGQEKGENPDDPRGIYIHGNRYSTSRNLVKPQPEPKAVEAEQWQKYPKPAAGYVIDENSLSVGTNPVTKKPYQFYIMLPVRVPMQLTGSKREAFIQRERAQNAALVRWKLDRLYEAAEEREREWQAVKEEGCKAG